MLAEGALGMEYYVSTQRSEKFLQKCANHRQKPPWVVAAHVTDGEGAVLDRDYRTKPSGIEACESPGHP
jgi:hypothetical protein